MMIKGYARMKMRGGKGYLADILLLCLMATAAVAQTGQVDQTTVTDNPNAFTSPSSIYSPLVSGINLQQLYNRFLDAYIDPEQYIVGPGDGFSVLFTAGDIANLSGEVNSDGSLFIKSVGPLMLFHLPLKEALEKIRLAVAHVYSPSEFSVQMSTFRVSRINIIGQVAHPGIYYAPAIWGASEVLGLAGGVTPQASLRSIRLTGFGKDVPVDLVRFAYLGDRQYNPMVCKGNLLIVPDRRVGTGHVAVTGAVEKPGVFEYVSGDRLADLIAFGGGVVGNINEMEVVVSNDGVETARLDGASPVLTSQELRPGDNIRLVWKSNRTEFGTVAITGAVVRPGQYALPQENITLESLLQLCGGPEARACPELTQVFRADREGRGRSGGSLTGSETDGGGVAATNSGGEAMVRVSLNPRVPRDRGSIMLADGDSVYVPSATGVVTVSGAVAAPGLVPYRRGETVDYYLRQAGGLGFDGDRARMVVINTLTGGKISATEAGTLFDGEILYVPRKESAAKP
jgi:protein involved in polysaccharide export with SLBB domain